MRECVLVRVTNSRNSEGEASRSTHTHTHTHTHKQAFTLNTTKACPRIFGVLSATTSSTAPYCENKKYSDLLSSAKHFRRKKKVCNR